MAGSCYWTRFICPKCNKPKAEMSRFAAEKGFIHKVAKQGDGRTSLRSASLKTRGLRYLWSKEAVWPDVWEKWLEIRKRWGKKKQVQLSSMLLHGRHVQKMTTLAYSEGGILVSLTKKVTNRTLTHVVLGGQWSQPVLTSLNLNWTIAASKFLKNNLRLLCQTFYGGSERVLCLQV